MYVQEIGNVYMIYLHVSTCTYMHKHQHTHIHTHVCVYDQIRGCFSTCAGSVDHNILGSNNVIPRQYKHTRHVVFTIYVHNRVFRLNWP